MFSEEFYPTPIGIVKKMIYPYLEKYDRHDKRFMSKVTILEPSAGSGNILDGITEDSIPYGNHNRRPEDVGKQYKDDGVELKGCNVYCIEKDKELQHILRGKGYKVIAEDFLTYSSDYIFDLILMNPPFSNGDEHLLKAWEILEEGDIVCLLNSETLKNVCTKRRELLARIVSEFGTVEELGPVFSKSERKTDVNVSLVRLKKIATKKSLDFEFQEINKEKKFRIDESNIHNAPALKDVIGNMIIQYDKVRETFIDFLKIHEQIRHYGDPLIAKIRSYYNNRVSPKADMMDLAKTSVEEGKNKTSAYNIFCDKVKSEMWDTVFDNLNTISSANLEKLMTSSVQKNWDAFMKQQGCMDFTRENVWSVIEMIFENKDAILERCITDVFDIFTSYYKENRYHVEGWKTNDRFKVNRKIILPHWLKMSWEKPADRMRFGASYQMSYSHMREYHDIDKALCYITGLQTNRITLLYDALENSFKQQGKIYKGPHRAECESEFFNIKYFMKATVHLEFKDEKLWDEFNMRACAGKNWLPEAEKNAWQEAKKSKEGKTRQMREDQLLIDLVA